VTQIRNVLDGGSPGGWDRGRDHRDGIAQLFHHGLALIERAEGLAS